MDALYNIKIKLNDEGLVNCKYDEERKRSICTTPKENKRKFDWSYNFGEGRPFYFVPLRYLP